MEEEVTDLISQVQLKLTVHLESRIGDMESARYRTLFLKTSSLIVTEMLHVGRAYSELVTKHPAMERRTVFFFPPQCF